MAYFSCCIMDITGERYYDFIRFTYPIATTRLGSKTVTKRWFARAMGALVSISHSKQHLRRMHLFYFQDCRGSYSAGI